MIIEPGEDANDCREKNSKELQSVSSNPLANTKWYVIKISIVQFADFVLGLAKSATSLKRRARRCSMSNGISMAHRFSSRRLPTLRVYS